MLLSEPPPSQGDLHFRAFGFPIRVHPFFWVVAVVLGLNRGEETPPAELIITVVVIFLSIVVHELGHAFAQRYFGGHPWITLYGLGGLASCEDCDRSPRSQILISLAGPVAGFGVAIVFFMLLKATAPAAYLLIAGQHPPQGATFTDPDASGFPGIVIVWERYRSNALNLVFSKAFWTNIAWGVLNLLPIYPLDGGRVARELFMLSQPRRGVILSLQLSMVVAGGMALYGLLAWQSFFTAFMFGYLAYSNYQTLQAYRANSW